jgi:hypothetical protein
MSRYTDVEIDEIIKNALLEMDIPEHLKTIDKLDNQARMMFACMLLINGSFVNEEGKIALKEWLKETAMMA